MGRNQAKVCIHLWMDQDMRVNGVMMIKTESEHSNSLMEMSIKDSLQMVREMALEFINMLMEISMMVIITKKIREQSIENVNVIYVLLIQGEWKTDKKEGLGTLEMATGDRYDGEWYGILF